MQINALENDTVTSTSVSASTAIVASCNLVSADINYDVVPKTGHMFRCGDFYTESEYLLGDQVHNYALEKTSRALIETEQVVHSGAYTFGTFLVDQSSIESETLTYGRYPVFGDRKPLLGALTDNSELTKFFLYDKKPSIELQMLAAALAFGYKQVFLIMPSLTQRTSEFSLFERLEENVRSNQQTSVDFVFLETLIKAFPDSRIFNGSTTYVFDDLLVAGDVLKTDQRLQPQPKITSSLSTGSGVDTGGEGGSSYYKIRRNKRTGDRERCAYVTYADNEAYLFGVRALANSLSKFSDIPLIVLTSQDFQVSGSKFASPHVRVLTVPKIRSPHTPLAHQERFTFTYTKLNVFQLSFLDKAVFLDGDTIVLQDIDDLFDLDTFAAAPDHGIKLAAGEFNSGVFVCQPSNRIFKDILEKAQSLGSRDAGDQGFLNSYFGNRAILPRRFNVLKRTARHLPAMFNADEMRVLHFVGEKPWDIADSAAWEPLDRLWFSMLGDEEKTDLIFWLKSQISEKFSKITTASSKIARQMLEDGKYVEAIHTAQAALKEKPDSILNLEIIRDAQQALGDLGSVQETSERITEIKHMRKWGAKPSRKLAEKYLADANYPVAIEVAHAALERTPDSVLNMRIIRKAHWSMGHFVQAAKMSWKIRKMRTEQKSKT